MELHDIFPEVPIVEYSLYVFMGLTLLGFVFLYFFYKLFMSRRTKVQPLHILVHYNPHDAKQTAHQVSYYGKKLAKSKIQKAYLAALEIKLNRYKYLETSPAISQELQAEIETFIQLLKGKHA